MEFSYSKHEWLIEADIENLQKLLDSGEISSVELVQAYIERIQQYDGTIRSILELNPEALEIAEQLDQERVQQGSRGILHGIPILLKDNIDTADQMHTSAGSVALASSIATEDSWVARKLREAGAILLGKTNMTEWAGYMSSTIWAGYSSKGGLTLNPYGPGELFIGGSSSGSAAATAASFAAAAIGTETSGSIICPSSQNFIVGIKPTVGLISRSGIIPLSHSQDTAGPMARTVADAAILLGALTGVDEQDNYSHESQGKSYRDYTSFLDKHFLKQARIGVPRHYYRYLDAERLAIMERAIVTLRAEGATIIDSVSLPCEQVEWRRDVMRCEFKKDVNDYLSKLGEAVPVHSLEEVIAYNETHADIALKYGQNILQWADETSGTLEEQSYLDAKAQNIEFARTHGIDHVLHEHQLDVLLLPGDINGCDLAARAGYPLITVPAGYAEQGSTTSEGWITKGPFGVVFAGTAYSEGTLIRIAYGFEQATKSRFSPELKSQ
ncbi:amidase family protein [Paenibacillus sp. N1-5-1-14]|uniref:amidase family protein n=1 Tax=Paenibacillus radicibacter TaxID=2972488 RepID=UPI002159B576|nr:amidase family protein [Paenibacillus radicibacter]MCR8642221.1 amidase family protein [Paenibacillus radicibacter]